MASLSTLIGNLTLAPSRASLEPAFNTGEIPRQDDFYGLIRSPLSRVDDGVFKTLDNPLCIQSADGDSSRNILHFYDDTTSDPIWELTIENDNLNFNNSLGRHITFHANGDLELTNGSMYSGNGSFQLVSSSGTIDATEVNVGAPFGTGLLSLTNSPLSLRQGGQERWSVQTDSNRLRFFNVTNGSGSNVNQNRLILNDSGSIEVPGGSIINNWQHTSGNANLQINNIAAGTTGGASWGGNYGVRSHVASNTGETKTGIVGEVYGSTGLKIAIQGNASGDNAVNYGIRSNASGDNGTKYGLYANATGTTFNYGVYGRASGSNTNFASYAFASGGSTNYGLYAYTSGGSGSTNYTIRGYAVGAGTNYVGWFSGTNSIVYVQDKLAIGITTPGSDDLDVRGRAYCSGGWQTTNADYGELFEASGGKSISQGTSVVFTRGGRIRPAKEGETPFGIVTKNSAVVGNSYREWPGKYELDEWGNHVMEEVDEEIEEFDPENSDPTQAKMVKTGNKVMKPKLSKKYNPKKEYVPREDRPEWCMVGLLGQLRLKKGQPIADHWVKIKKINDEIDLYLVK